MPDYDPLGFGLELQEQIASGTRQSGFFFGAGSSIASGLPDIEKLTDRVEAELKGDEQKRFKELRASCGNIELILNRVRALREILDGADSHLGLTHESAKKLDLAICNCIY